MEKNAKYIVNRKNQMEINYIPSPYVKESFEYFSWNSKLLANRNLEKKIKEGSKNNQKNCWKLQ